MVVENSCKPTNHANVRIVPQTLLAHNWNFLNNKIMRSLKSQTMSSTEEAIPNVSSTEFKITTVAIGYFN